MYCLKTSSKYDAGTWPVWEGLRGVACPYCLVFPPQCVKLLYSESKKGSTLLYYIVGGRVLDYVQRAMENERALTKMLRYAFG